MLLKEKAVGKSQLTGFIGAKKMIHELGSAQNWKSFTESPAGQHGQWIYTQSKEVERS